MKKFFYVVCFAIVSCTELDAIVSELNSEAEVSEISTIVNRDITKITTKDNYTYYVSAKGMNWVDAYNFCENKGKYFANYLRPICPLKTDEIVDVLNNKLNYTGACNNLTGLTDVDTYVWFYPALSGKYGVVVNLKSGAVVMHYIYDREHNGMRCGQGLSQQ